MGGGCMIKAIETRYKGYRFRSRMEARWAVFFDTLKIRYEYEMEGFDLGNGEKYLPDFWFPDFCAWGEVKYQPLQSDGSLNKAICLIGGKWEDEGSDTPLIELQGVPDFKFYRMFCVTDIPIHFFDSTHRPILAYNTGKKSIVILEKYVALLPECMGKYQHMDWGTFYEAPDWAAGMLKDVDYYVNAIDAAKTARFEHGEHP
jgi:hypothetical protein